MSAVRRLARSPILHFALLGGVLFAGRAMLDARRRAAQPAREPIVISAERVRVLEASFAQRWGGAPTLAQHTALIEQAAQEELLYREARVLALGLEDGSVRRRLLEKIRAVGDRAARSEDELVQQALALGFDDDVVIRRLLAEKMRLVLEQPSGEAPTSDAEIAAYLEQHAAEWRQPATVSLTQVFLSGELHGARLAADADAALAELRSGEVPTDRAAERSDPSPLDAHLRAYSFLQLQARFGKSFAERVFALEPGAWSEPIASPYGLHLVRIEERRAERLPTVNEVRSAVRGALRRERAQQNLARGLARLRSLYEVRVEDSSAPGIGAVAMDARR